MKVLRYLARLISVACATLCLMLFVIGAFEIAYNLYSFPEDRIGSRPLEMLFALGVGFAVCGLLYRTFAKVPTKTDS
jgi:hypothetical protein